ncbi:MAG TPA: FHA domain-containing protein [Angustibacter sp.]|nr:FHA domain-containing protein [Angustibacter sp.]
MSELTVTVVRLGLLAVLWVFVFSVVGVLRGDLFGTKVTQRSAQRPAPAAHPAQTARRGQRTSRRTPSHVLVSEGPLKGTTITLGQNSVLIGRNPESTLVLDDDYASGRHARIYPENGEWYVEDLDSTNGTFAGNQRLTSPQKLQVGSTLRIGTTVLELRR